MNAHFLSNDTLITSYKDAPARTITAGGVTFAYRELGPKGGVPVVFFVHLAANLDNWDPMPTPSSSRWASSRSISSRSPSVGWWRKRWWSSTPAWSASSS